MSYVVVTLIIVVTVFIAGVVFRRNVLQGVKDANVELHQKLDAIKSKLP